MDIGLLAAGSASTPPRIDMQDPVEAFYTGQTGTSGPSISGQRACLGPGGSRVAAGFDFKLCQTPGGAGWVAPGVPDGFLAFGAAIEADAQEGE